MLSTILVAVLGAAVSGVSGYYISFRFNRSDYAATDRSGDFGTPRGGFFALMSGMLIGLLFLSAASHLHIFPAESIGPAMIVSMVVGAVAGFLGLVRAQKSRTKPEDNGSDSKTK